MSTGMILSGIFASECLDSSAEVLDIKGIDTSDFDAGLGLANFEHKGDGKDGNPDAIVGKVLWCKKIFGPEDCSNEKEREAWDKTEHPLLFGYVRLFDGSGSPGAVALAAQIRDFVANGEGTRIAFSIEGVVLKRDGQRLLKSVARRVALTYGAANKSCEVTELVADPVGNTFASKTEKAEIKFHSIDFMPLGGTIPAVTATVIDDIELIKSLEAGSYNSAPGTLVGGSALQVEDKSLKNRIKAAVRDWDKTTPFKKFLKTRLPEVSDEYLQRFSDASEDIVFKKAVKEITKKLVTSKIKEKEAKPKEGALTIRGKAVKPNLAGTKTSFDENKGILHTEAGSFPMYIPSKDKETPDAGQKFHNIMNDPKVSKFHDYAMQNWTKVHQHLKNGTLPPEVVMHGVLFSQMSPNTPVPHQELQYAHLVDAMNSTRTDPRNPQTLDKLKRDWLNRDQGSTWPEHSRDHFARLEDHLRLKNDSKASGRKAGEIGGFMLANNKWDNVSQYHTLHNSLVDLIGRHRHDARAGVQELMYHKDKSGLWNAVRKRALAAGKADPGEYKDGPSVPGLAPKTARYTYGMLGGSNVTVPDTHFARYLFGLDRAKDGNSIDHIKNTLWDPKNTETLNAIDRYYAKHHDAVKHMQQHPTWGKHFEKPEDAVFPAFWKNWVGILPHEATRGMASTGFNESTDHKPFWDAVNPLLGKSEETQSLPERTAKTHVEWVKKYGEMQALLMYFHYLVPQLLDAAKQKEESKIINKFDTLLSTLQKSFETAAAGPGAVKRQFENKVPGSIKFNGKTVKPGIAEIHNAGATPNSKVYLIDHDATHYTAVPKEKINGWSADDLVRLPKAGLKNYTIRQHPEHLEASGVIDSKVHGLPEYTRHPEVHDLIHGLDLTGPKSNADTDFPEDPTGLLGRGINQGVSFWTKNAKGDRVYVKGERQTSTRNRSDFGEANREALYHNLAKDFYGLGDFVQPTAAITHPRTGERMSVIKHFPEGEHREKHHLPQLKKLKEDGSLHKLALMNVINGNEDRHDGNYLLGPKGLKLIDHGLSFDKNGTFGLENVPNYLYGVGNHEIEPIHPAAVNWIKGLDPAEMRLQMQRHGVPEEYVSEATRRLGAIQQHLKNKSAPHSSLADVIHSSFQEGE